MDSEHRREPKQKNLQRRRERQNMILMQEYQERNGQGLFSRQEKMVKSEQDRLGAPCTKGLFSVHAVPVRQDRHSHRGTLVFNKGLQRGRIGNQDNVKQEVGETGLI
jgi:hypothetical protein